MQSQLQPVHKELLRLPSLEVFFFVAARQSLHHEELEDIVRQLHQESGLPRIVKADDLRKKKSKKKKKEKSTTVIDEVKKGKPVKISFGYQHDLADEYAQHMPFFMSEFYSIVNVYKLHYDEKSTARTVEEGEDHQEKHAPIRRVQKIEEESPEQMNQTIQHIIYARLFGALGDLSFEEKEKFSKWRQFNKHMRRFYEGAYYASSITKSV